MVQIKDSKRLDQWWYVRIYKISLTHIKKMIKETTREETKEETQVARWGTRRIKR